METIAALGSPLALVAGALAVLLLEAFLGRRRPKAPAAAAFVFLAAAAFCAVRAWGKGWSYFGGRLQADELALALTVLFVLAGAAVLLMGLDYALLRGVEPGPFAGLVLLALAGAAVMVSSTDGLVVFLGLEILSVASYALTGLQRAERASAEAAAKYFLMGSFAGAFFVFGLAFVYGSTGGLVLTAGAPAAALGTALVLTALFFKAAVAPFHMWAPDVYEGAPTPVAAFLTLVPKAAGLAVALRIALPRLGPAAVSPLFTDVLSAAAVLTMFAGALGALRQKSFKRMLAYSSIAHSGFLLVAVVARDAAGLVFYLAAYLFMNTGAFGVLALAAGPDGEPAAIADLAGLGRRAPWLAAGLTVFLLSLAGFPPTAGFLAKFTVFGAAVREGRIALTVAAVLASLVSAAFYLRVVVAMYMEEGGEPPVGERNDPAMVLVLFLCLFGVIQLGLWPGNLMALIRGAFPAPF
jgi:NADH-quinone oxidoreductase subunit N